MLPLVKDAPLRLVVYHIKLAKWPIVEFNIVYLSFTRIKRCDEFVLYLTYKPFEVSLAEKK